MDITRQASAIALAVAAVSIVVAAIFALLRETAGVPVRRRLPLMASFACSAVMRVLPSRQYVVILAAWMLSFFGTLFLGLEISVIVVDACVPKRPPPTEVFEAMGEFFDALPIIVFGTMVTAIVATIVATSVSRRLRSWLGDVASAANTT